MPRSIGDELARENAQSECEFHINQLQEWLNDHQPNSDWTTDMRHAFLDRKRSLLCWRGRRSILNREGKL
jgi:hypothetical protein